MIIVKEKSPNLKALGEVKGEKFFFLLAHHEHFLESYSLAAGMIHKLPTTRALDPNTHKENCHIMYQMRCV